MAIVEEARSHIGERFALGSRASATDCGGLILQVAKAMGMQHRDLSWKYTLASSAGLSLYVHCRQFGDELRLTQVQPGTVLIFWVRHSDHPQHLGIWTGEKVVHAKPSRDFVGCVTEDFLGGFAKRVYAAFDFRRIGAPAQHEIPINDQVPCEECVLASPQKFTRRKQFKRRDCWECEHSKERL